ncbi:MAG: hypothetical protein KDB80_14405 [Planctomycetes bacterium]|nr:hypothetical protein [Planctomycetota bacterium]
METEQIAARSARIGIFGMLFGLTMLALPSPALAQGQEPTEAEGIDLQFVEGGRIAVSVDENRGVAMLDFIKLAEQITKKTFVFSDADMSANPTITFVGTVTLPRTEFFGFFQTMLYIKSFACVIRNTGDSQVVEIVNMQGAKRGEISTSSLYVAPEDIAEYANQTGVTILTSVPLQHIKATTATTTLRPFFTATGQVGNLSTGNVGNDRALLLQGFGPQVYAAYQLLRLVDVPPELPEQETRVVELAYATAEELEPILTKVLEDRSRRIEQQAGPTGGNLPTGRGSQLTISGLASHNSLLISGSPDEVISALDLIAKLDVPLEASTGDIHVIQLRNVLAEDLQTTLRNFIQEDLQAAQQAQSTAGASPQRRERKTVIVAHTESNSLLVSATQTKFKQLERMIKNLDKRQPQVMIEAALVELTTDDLDTLGVEIGILDIGANEFTRGFGFSQFGISNYQDTDDDGLPDTRLPDFENPLQGITGGIIASDDFAIPLIVNALQQDNRANILSLPSVVVNNNQTAAVSSKEVRPTTTTSQGTATTQSGVGPDQEAGIELSISPTISNDDYLRLNITLNVSRFLTTADPNAITGGPRTEREVQTQVTLPSGHTMVIGGVIEDTESYSDSGVPYLKDIPLLGALFRRSTEQTIKTNLYFFITPTILDDDEFADLAELTQRKKLESAQYIGHRRLRIVDPNWTGGTSTLEDTGATIEDIDRLGGFDFPHYNRPSTPPSLDRLPIEEIEKEARERETPPSDETNDEGR